MMIRILTGTLLCLLLAAPASGQSLRLVDGSVPEQGATTLRLDMSAAATPAVSASRSGQLATAEQAGMTFGRRATAVAASLVRTLAAQNRITIDPPEDQMDGYLRPPSADDGGSSTIFHEAKALYDDATHYGNSRYDVSFDPLSLKAYLRVNLGR